MNDKRPRPISERLSKLPPGRHLLPRDLVSRNQRERILLATVELVAERGYQKTTIELIAKTARVALVTFYEQFASKEECFLAAFDDSVEMAAELFGERLDEERPWSEQIASGMALFLEMVTAEPARAKLCLVESQAAGGAALARYQAMLERVAPKLREGRDLHPRASRLPEGLEVASAGGPRLARPAAADLRPRRPARGTAAGDAPGDVDPLRRGGRGGARRRSRPGAGGRIVV
jgi:AcrR family transcriptional regulator